MHVNVPSGFVRDWLRSRAAVLLQSTYGLSEVERPRARTRERVHTFTHAQNCFLTAAADAARAWFMLKM